VYTLTYSVYHLGDSRMSDGGILMCPNNASVLL